MKFFFIFFKEIMSTNIEQYLNKIHPKFNEFINPTNIISGSLVLYFYLLENGITPQFEPKDIDIYSFGDKKFVFR